MFLFSLSMILVVLFAPPIPAEELNACSLLPASDIEATTGGQVSRVEPMQLDDIEAEPNRATKVLACVWGFSNLTGNLTVTWFRGPLTEEEIAQLIKVSKDNTGIESMKNANYREVSKDFPNAWCSTSTPPASEKGDQLSTCAGGVKGHGVAVSFNSRTTSLTIDQAKALFDRAGERAR